MPKAPDVYLTLSLVVGGQPVWRVARKMKPELTIRMDEAEYMKALEAAGIEHAKQVADFKKRNNKPL